MARRQSPSLRPAFPVAASLLASSAMIAPISGHGLPRQTVQPTATTDDLTWSVQSTLGPVIPPLPTGREFNTVCGYIGGDPSLPATCIEDTHCVADVEHKAIGCCPDDGDCAKGIFTGCVDGNNPGGSVVDPHIYTCGTGDVCYRNTFEGGFFQYGCGSTSELATMVALTAPGQPVIAYTTVSVSLRSTVTMTTGTNSDGKAPSSTLGRDSKPTGSDSSEDKGGVDHTTAIVGGVVGGLVALVLLLILAAFLWRRKKNSKAPEPEEEPNRPLASPDNDYEDTEDLTDTRPAPKPPGPTNQSEEELVSWPIPLAMKGGIIGGANGVMDTDQTPLTQENVLAPTNNIENFSPVDTGSAPRRGGERPFWQQTGGGRTRNLTRS